MTGTVTSRLTVPLERCWLVHGGWLYDVGRMEPGAPFGTEAGRGPRSLTAALTRRAAVKDRDLAERLVPDIVGVYDDMRVGEYLEFFAAAYRIDGPARRQVAERSLELVDLGSKRDELVTSLTRGMTQRRGLARVLLHDPEVLLLDEPASGLDPRAWIEMRNLLKLLQGMGKTILVSSRILSELADICNRVGIIEYGRLLACGDVQELLVAFLELTRGALAKPADESLNAGTEQEPGD